MKEVNPDADVRVIAATNLESELFKKGFQLMKDVPVDAYCIDGDCRLPQTLQEQCEKAQIPVPQMVRDLSHMERFHKTTIFPIPLF